MPQRKQAYQKSFLVGDDTIIAHLADQEKSFLVGDDTIIAHLADQEKAFL